MENLGICSDITSHRLNAFSGSQVTISEFRVESDKVMGKALPR